jgi:glycosyltransferase involved in cell wall biosynthesis
LWGQTLTAIRKAHRRASFDLIHAIWADESGLIANLAGRLLNVPTVVSIAGGELVGLPDIGYGLQRGRLSRAIVGAALRGANCVIAPSQVAAEMARRWVRSDRLIVSPLGVDTALFTPAAQQPNDRAKHLIAVGSLTPIKDQATLLRALARLRRSDVMLEIVGEGYLGPALRAQAEALGIGDRVRIRGAVAHEELPAWYRAADLHVLTSRHEAFGMVVLEAAACGVPTIGYARGIVPEMAAKGAAIAIEPGNEAGLVDAIDAVLADPDRLRAMRHAAQTRIAERFTLDAMTHGILSTYATIIP